MASSRHLLSLLLCVALLCAAFAVAHARPVRPVAREEDLQHPEEIAEPRPAATLLTPCFSALKACRESFEPGTLDACRSHAIVDVGNKLHTEVSARHPRSTISDSLRRPELHKPPMFGSFNPSPECCTIIRERFRITGPCVDTALEEQCEEHAELVDHIKSGRALMAAKCRLDDLPEGAEEPDVSEDDEYDYSYSASEEFSREGEGYDLSSDEYSDYTDSAAIESD